MSNLGSMQIGNLRTPMDYRKAVQTQDELLRIAIANDLNVSEARKLYQAGETLLPAPQDLKSPSELQADDAYQEQTGLQNLLKLFPYREAGQILSALSRDQIFVMNMSFPDIEQDLKKRFNTKLINPSFFQDYLRRYVDELQASKGVSSNLAFIQNKFDDLTTNIQDIKSNIPTITQIRSIVTSLSKKINKPSNQMRKKIIMDRLIQIQDAMPDENVYQVIEEETPVTKYQHLEAIQNITANFPTRDELNDLQRFYEEGIYSEDEVLQEIQNKISAINNNQLVQLQDLKTKILNKPVKPSKRLYREQYSIPVTGVKNVASLSIGKEPQGKREFVYINLDDGNSYKITPVTIDQLKNDLSFMKFYTQKTGLTKLRTVRDLKNLIYSESKISPDQPNLEQEEFGITGSGFHYAKNGRLVSDKFGKGVDIAPEATYKTFGKFVVHMPQLKNRDLLNMKYRSLGKIPNFKATPVSEVMKDFLLDLLETGKANHRVYDTIPIEERKMFEKVATNAGIIHGLGLKQKTLSDEDVKDAERFEILKAEYGAGNNSPTLLKELRKLVVKFMNNGRITKSVGTDLLIEFSV